MWSTLSTLLIYSAFEMMWHNCHNYQNLGCIFRYCRRFLQHTFNLNSSDANIFKKIQNNPVWGPYMDLLRRISNFNKNGKCHRESIYVFAKRGWIYLHCPFHRRYQRLSKFILLYLDAVLYLMKTTFKRCPQTWRGTQLFPMKFKKLKYTLKFLAITRTQHKKGKKIVSRKKGAAVLGGIFKDTLLYKLCWLLNTGI